MMMMTRPLPVAKGGEENVARQWLMRLAEEGLFGYTVAPDARETAPPQHQLSSCRSGRQRHRFSCAEFSVQVFFVFDSPRGKLPVGCFYSTSCTHSCTMGLLLCAGKSRPPQLVPASVRIACFVRGPFGTSRESHHDGGDTMMIARPLPVAKGGTEECSAPVIDAARRDRVTHRGRHHIQSTLRKLPSVMLLPLSLHHRSVPVALFRFSRLTSVGTVRFVHGPSAPLVIMMMMVPS